MRSTRSRRRLGCLGLLALLLLLAGSTGGWAYGLYHRVRPELDMGQQQMTAAVQQLRQDPVTSITPANLAQARASFAAAARNFSAASADLQPVAPLLGLAAIAPAPGGDLSQVPDLLSLATHAALLGVALCDALAPPLELINGHAPAGASAPSGGLTGSIDSLIEALQARPAALASARAELAAVEAARGRINAGRVSTHQVLAALNQVDTALPDLDRALATVDSLPRLLDVLLGRSQPTTYLLLAQNSDELRATGGFVSSVGQLTVANGHFDQLAFEDSYAVDPGTGPVLAPPVELTHYLGATQWYIRDSNWSADFPTSAHTAETFYQAAKQQAVDGTVAVDQHTVQLLVSALGPIQLDGYPDVITGDNVEDLLHHYFMPQPGGMSDAWWKHRKDFMRDLFHGLVKQMNGLDRPHLLALALALRQGLDEKHILISMHDPDTARWLHDQGWDGALADEPGDYLMVVDTNLGFNKVNPHIQATTTYAVTMAATGAAQAVLTLTYQNTSTPQTGPCVRDPTYKASYVAMEMGCYWDLVRVYVPAGAQLQGASRDGAPLQVQAAPGLGKTAFSTDLTLPPGAQQTLQFRYTLPLTLTAPGGAGLPGQEAGYRLLVQKQPGTLERPLTVTLTLPPTVTLRQARPNGVLGDGVLHWDGLTLRQDQRLSAGW
ncbi:MAG TPA: DUF4012 domain-containing protein [Chloroflexia bacterium]|nr:DUF4012 domain-containing protein [Chloroflexia bacterium]